MEKDFIGTTLKLANLIDRQLLEEIVIEIIERPFMKNENTINQKELFMISNEQTLKIGNNIRYKSIRCDNQINMIARNLIQEIFLDWINYGETDNSKKLYKINPKIFGQKYDFFKGKTLKKIYSEEISKKLGDNEHNIIIIDSAEGDKKIKLNFTFEEALKLFYYKNNVAEDLSEIINIDKNKEEIIKSNILEGLIGKEDYINRKTKAEDSIYKQKLLLNLDKIKEIYIPKKENKIVYIDSILDEMDKYIFLDLEHRFPFYKIRATVTHLKHTENNYYARCPNRKCNKKIYFLNGDWMCQYCRQSFKKPKYYYSLNLKVKDCSSEYCVDIFGEPAELIMNMSADDYRNILINKDNEKLNQIIENVEYKEFYFLLKIWLNKFNNTINKEFTVIKIKKINKKEEIGRLVGDIKKKLKIE